MSNHAPPSPFVAADEQEISLSPGVSIPSSAELHPGDAMVEFAADTLDHEVLGDSVVDFAPDSLAIEVQGDMKGQVVPDTIDDEAEDSADEERSSDISLGDVDEDSVEYLRRQIVPDSEEENEQDEAYQKIRKEFNLRRASEAALRKEARSRNAPGHKRSLNKIRRDFLGYHLPGYYKIGKK